MRKNDQELHALDYSSNAAHVNQTRHRLAIGYTTGRSNYNIKD